MLSLIVNTSTSSVVPCICHLYHTCSVHGGHHMLIMSTINSTYKTHYKCDQFSSIHREHCQPDGILCSFICSQQALITINFHNITDDLLVPILQLGVPIHVSCSTLQLTIATTYSYRGVQFTSMNTIIFSTWYPYLTTGTVLRLKAQC